MKSTNEVYVLVHGAWHGGWCWSALTTLLRDQGHHVSAPTLAGLGEHAQLISHDINLSSHVENVVAHIELEDLQGVTLVGHSYGGMVITGVLARISERIKTVIYLDAFVPQDGQALVDLVLPAHVDAFNGLRQAKKHIPQFPPAHYGITDPDQVKWLAPRLCPQPIETFFQPVKAPRSTPKHVKRAFIRCVNDPLGDMSPFGKFGTMAKTDSTWTYLELPTGHDAMLTIPEQLKAALGNIAGV